MRVSKNQHLIVDPDVVFIDINMPGLTGDKCLRAIGNSKLYDNVYIAMYSTLMPEGASDALKRLGSNITFEKPAVWRNTRNCMASP